MDGMSIDAFPEFARHHWERIRLALDQGTYRPAAVLRVMIPKATGGQRPLGIPTVLNRVIQQAILANIMLDDLDKELEARGLQFARYADDFLIFVHSRNVLLERLETAA